MMKARKILRILEDQVGTMGSPTIQFVNPTNVVFRFNDNMMKTKVKTDLSIFMSAHVSPLTITDGFEESEEKPYFITVQWKPLSDPYSTAIKNDLLFLSTKYKMTKV